MDDYINQSVNVLFDEMQALRKNWLDLHIFSCIPVLDSDDESEIVKRRRKWVQ